MLDYSNKEFVRSFVVSNMRQDRTITKQETIFGRTYIKFGTACATTMAADCWKVWDPSVERFKYVYLAGVARQHPCDISIKYSDGVEIAHENAMTNPVMTMVFDSPIAYEQVEAMMWNYIDSLPEQLVKTSQEIEFDEYQKDIEDYEFYECE